VTFGLMVRGLLADVAKKKLVGFGRVSGLATPQPLEHLLGGARWDADVLREQVRGYVLRGLADPGGALVLDDTQVIKKGAKSVGVAPQHCGLTGQTENCQVMVMLIYASRHGHAFVDRALYLPRVWTADPQRCAAAGVSTDVEFVTKPHLGVAMLGRALADAALAFSWFVADSGYGARPGPAPVLPRQPGVLCAGRPGGPAPARRVRQATSPRRGVGRYPEHRMAAAFGR